jgi:hypothetical protein
MPRTFHWLVVAALLTAGAFAAGSARAQVCDFITGSGTVQSPFGGLVNFAVDGGCRQLANWGYLNVRDKSFSPPGQLKSIRITAYFTDATHPNARHICGEGEVVKDAHGMSFQAKFHVKVEDNAGAGPDRFGLRIVEAEEPQTERYHLSMRELLKGNIERYKDNPSTPGPGGAPQCEVLPPDDFPSSPVGLPL